MKTILTMILVLIAGQTRADEQLIDVQHDSVRGVTCWILNNTGISCLPDSSLLQVPTSTTTGEDQAARASLATSMCQTQQFTTTPLPQEKGLQL